MNDIEQGKSAEGGTDFSADMIDEYVQGRLPPEQRAEFESFIIDKPDLLEQVELGLLMREGFRANEVAPARASARAEISWRLAAAAAVVSVGLGSLIGLSIGDGTSDSLMMAGNQLVASQIVNLPITRSQAPRRVAVAIDPDAQLIVMRVPLPNPESRLYQVTIAGRDGPIGEPSVTQPDGGGMLNLALNSAVLEAGTYSIVVSVPGADDPDPGVGAITLEVTNSL